MSRLANLNLIDLFGFYLAAMFLLGTWRRLSQYRAVGALLLSAPGRWPKLLQVMKKYRAIFLTWSTFRPAVLALLLTIIHMIASRVIWPQTQSRPLTAIHLFDSWIILVLLLATALPMLAVDAYFLIRVGRINRVETEKYLDQAEYWLTGWKAPVVRILTFGYVDPRRMVSVEVEQAMTSISDLLNRNLYWMSLQIALRVLFGLTLWLVWAYLALDNG